jgi:hypothetical protein
MHMPERGTRKMKTSTKNRRRTKNQRQKPRKPGKPRKALYTLQQRRSWGYRALSFPEVKGKKTEKVELVTSTDYHAVVVIFEDETAVGFEFEPGFTARAYYEDINGKDGVPSRTWPEIRNERQN